MLFRFLVVSVLFSSSFVAAKVRVLTWSERSEPVDVYPNGINGAIRTILEIDRGISVEAVNLLDPQQGLDESALDKTDVLVWFGHLNHADVTDENVARIVRHVVERGMGFLPLHSAHASRPLQKLFEVKAKSIGIELDGRIGAWSQVTNHGKPEKIRVLEPRHPIVRGVADFVIPVTQMYVNPLNAPPADLKILEGSWEGGEQHGSDGLIWRVGKGKIFYFRPGHQTRPIYRQPEVQQILRNAIRWLAKR